MVNCAKRLRINPLMVSPSNHWNDWNKLSWAAVCDMPDVPWQKVTACSWHRSLLGRPFHGQKGEPNPLRQRLERFEPSAAIERLERLSLRPNDAFYSILAC